MSFIELSIAYKKKFGKQYIIPYSSQKSMEDVLQDIQKCIDTNEPQHIEYEEGANY